jgi:CelD/BcsL family acetyltransferase involved in cellulose biosynthesis
VLESELIDSVEGLEPWCSQWDRLALAAGRPYTAPAWQLAWWRHLSPVGAQLRTVIVRDCQRLVAIAPCLAQRERPGFVEYRLLGAGTSHRIDPLAVAGEEERVVPLIATTLAASRPRASTLRLEGLDAASLWPRLLSCSWGGALRPWVHRDVVLPAPALRLTGSGYEEWMSAKSRHFRSAMRRQRRRLEGEGAAIRLIQDPRELGAAIGALVSLHRERWGQEDGSGEPDGPMEELLRDAARELAPQQRLRIWVVEVGSRIVAAQLFVVANGTLAFWGGGFDAEWSAYSPSNLLILAAIEDAFRRGESLIDFGGGDQAYKLRFADSDAPVVWWTLFPRGARYPLARAHTLPRHTFWRVRGWARRNLRPETQERLKRLLRRN